MIARSRKLKKLDESRRQRARSSSPRLLVACSGSEGRRSSAKSAPGGSTDPSNWPADDRSMCDYHHPDLETSRHRRTGRAQAQRPSRVQDGGRGGSAAQDAGVPRDRHQPRWHQGRRPQLQRQGRSRCARTPTPTYDGKIDSLGSRSWAVASPRKTSTRDRNGRPDSVEVLFTDGVSSRAAKPRSKRRRQARRLGNLYKRTFGTHRLRRRFRRPRRSLGS